MVRTQSYHCWSEGSIAGWGTKVPQAVICGQTKCVMRYMLKRDNVFKKYLNDMRKRWDFVFAEAFFCCCYSAYRLNLLMIIHLYLLIGKGQFSFQSQRRAMTKNVQTAAQSHSLHMLAR